MNPLLNAEMMNARSTDVARGIKRHTAAPGRSRSAARSRTPWLARMFSALLSVRHAA